MKIGSYLAQMLRKSRRVYSIILLVLLGLVFSLSISMLWVERSVGTEVAMTQAQSDEQKCANLRVTNNPSEGVLKALSSLKRGVFDRTREPICFQQALEHAKQALESNEQGDWLQEQLKQLSLLIDVNQWLEKTKRELADEQWIFRILKANTRKLNVAETLKEWGGMLEKQLTNLQTIENKLKSNTQPSSSSDIYAQINLAWNLNRLIQDQELVPKFDRISWNKTSRILLEKAIQNAPNLNNKIDAILAKSYALGYYGNWYETRKNYDEARKATEEAAKLAESIGDKSIRENTVYQWEWQLGRIYKAQYEAYKDTKALESAIAAYNAAYNTLQALRLNLVAGLEDKENKNEIEPFVFRDKVEDLVYREFVDVLLQPESLNQENSKNNPSQKNFKENSSQENSKNKPSQKNLKKAREIIASLQIAELESFLGQPCAGLNPELIDQIVEQENPPKAAVFYPIILENRLAVILKLPGKEKLKYYETRKNQPYVQDTLRQLRYSLEQPYFSSIGKQKAQEVYQWLIGKAEEESLLTSNVETLLFVPDGLLRNIPMAALYDGKQFLIQKYPIGVAPSLQVSATKSNKFFNVLIAGLSEDPGIPGFGPLEYAEKEVCAIQQIFNNSLAILNGKVADCQKSNNSKNTQKSSTSEYLREQLNSSKYNVVHLATHGQFSFFNRQETFMLTSFKLGSSELSLFDLEGIRSSSNLIDSAMEQVNKINLDEWRSFFRGRGFNPIELLVLSACETATGDDRDTLGIAGVAVQAGARSTIASLWTVDDSSTAKFMEEFYKVFIEGKSKALALQKAQIRLLRDFGYQPSRWTPYVLVGDWR